MNAGTVLLVEDDAATLDVLRRAVEGMGLASRGAGSRAQAREFLRRGDYDALVSDVGLETPDAGVLLAQEARVMRPGLPVVLVTGAPDLATALPAFRSGASDYLAKPFRVDDLRGALRRALDARRDPREDFSAAFARIKAAERSREGMLAILDHELRTPMCVARLAADRLDDEPCGPDGEKTRRLLRRGLDRLEASVSDVLLHARLSAGLRPALVRPVDLAEIAAEQVRAVAGDAAAREVHIELVADLALPAVPGDRDLLGLAARHLLLNAVRYNRLGGRAFVCATGDSERRELVVADEGPGIPTEALGHVFDPYYQVADFMTRGTGGLGLGLAIVRGVFEGHGGGVSVANRPGGGCEFRAWLPARARSAA